MTRNALITGTSAGLGQALALRLLDEGWNVMGISRTHSERLEARPGFQWRMADLGAPKTVQWVLQDALPSGGGLDLVVLNAAQLGRIADLADASLSELRALTEVNLWSAKAVLDAVFSRCSSVVQVVAISSGVSRHARRGWGGYSISKAALDMLVGLYAAERPGTHFTSLAPGIVDTGMQQTLCSPEQDVDRFPSLVRLRDARGTADMPTPEVAAARLYSVLGLLRDLPSGSWADLRQLQVGA